MIYNVEAVTDIGTSRKINQDSLVVRHIKSKNHEVVMAIICDGIGGLSEGEVASSTVIEFFSEWFENQVKNNYEFNLEFISNEWTLMLKELNFLISDYGTKHNIRLGTTFTGILFYDFQFLIVHIGDTRLYQLNNKVSQLTTDQTYISRAIAKGEITEEEALIDKRKNVLLQCVGASKFIEPQILFGKASDGGYLLCSDGFRHKIDSKDILENLCNKNIKKNNLKKQLKYLVDLNKSRGEKDNISAIYINCNLGNRDYNPKHFILKKKLIAFLLFILFSILSILFFITGLFLLV